MSTKLLKVNEADYSDVLVEVKRVTKVVKGGRNFSFTAIVVVGDQKGKVGFGTGKAKEVAEARDKARKDALKNVIRVPLKENRTIHHDVIGHFRSGKVKLRVAPPGTGIIAGGAMRTAFDLLGIQDIVAKSIGSSNSHNILRATFDAFDNLNSPKFIAEKRSMKVSEIVARREVTSKTVAATNDDADKE